MTEAIGAAKGERSETRVSYRSGYYGRSLITRIGTLELRVPQGTEAPHPCRAHLPERPELSAAGPGAG